MLKGLGITAAGIAAFTTRTADAAETVRESVQRQSELLRAASEDHSSWWEWVPIIGDIWGGELNAGEGLQLEAMREAERRDRFVAEVVADAVADIEADKRASLGTAERADVEEFVRMVLASGLDVTEEAE